MHFNTLLAHVDNGKISIKYEITCTKAAFFVTLNIQIAILNMVR